MQRLGLDNEGLGEVLAVVGLFNQMNKLADAYQVEPDILPEARGLVLVGAAIPSVAPSTLARPAARLRQATTR